MKRFNTLLRASFVLALLSCFTISEGWAQTWTPSGSTTNAISRTGNVNMGNAAASYGSSNTAVNVNNGTLTYQVGKAVQGTQVTDGPTSRGTGSGELGFGVSYFANGAISGVRGITSVDFIRASFAGRTSYAEGGTFSINIDDPIPAGSANTGTHLISGVRGQINGNITTYPGDGWVAAVAGNDLIQGTNTWGGYFRGRGYFEDQVGIGTENPIAQLDVRGNNIFLSSNPGPGFPSQFAAMGESGGQCDVFGFRAQENSNTFMSMGIEDGTRPTISWGSSGDLEFDCDANASGCGTKVVSFSCPGMFQVEVNGPGIFSGGTYVPADQRLMSDVQELSSAMDRLQGLRAVNFNFNQGTETEYKLSDAPQVGFIANEVAKVMPEAVRSDDDGINAVNLNAMVPYLVEGVKELDNRSAADQMVNEEQAIRINELERELAELKALVSQLAGGSAKGDQAGSIAPAMDAARLSANAPNPFENVTYVEYYVPGNARTATIEVSNLSGQVQAEFPANIGEGQVTIPVGSMANGVYLYSLVVDGAKVATRRMVVSK